MKILLIDNFDSFTFNLYQYIGELCPDIEVARNNQIPFEKLSAGEYTHIVISPGPGNPTDPAYFGDVAKVIDQYKARLPMLGICLGHQGIGSYFGMSVIKAPSIMHGKTSTFTHNGQGLFRGLPDEITVMRYHSLVVDEQTKPDELVIDAVAEDGSVMGFHHENLSLFGIQFHPESFMTASGKQILENFLEIS